MYDAGLIQGWWLAQRSFGLTDTYAAVIIRHVQLYTHV